MPQPMHCDRANFQFEGRSNQFDLPHTSAPAGGTLYRDSSRKSVSVQSIQSQRGRAFKIRKVARKFFGRQKKSTFEVHSVKLQQGNDSQWSFEQNNPEENNFTPKSFTSTSHARTNTMNSTPTAGTQRTNTMDSFDDTTKAPRVSSTNSAGYVLPSEMSGTHPADRDSLHASRGGRRSGSFTSKTSGPSMRSRFSSSSFVRARPEAGMAYQELFSRDSVPQVVVSSPTWEGEENDRPLRCHPSLARREADAFSTSHLDRVGSSLYVTNPDDASYFPPVSATPACLTLNEQTVRVSPSSLRVANPDVPPSEAQSYAKETLRSSFDLDFELLKRAEPVMDRARGTAAQEYDRNLTFEPGQTAQRLVGRGEPTPYLQSHTKFRPSLTAYAEEVDDADLVPVPLDPNPTPAAITRNRNEALAALDGQIPAPAPAPHLPASLKPQPYPTSLMPGPQYKDADGNVRAQSSTFQASSRPESPPLVEGPDSYNSFNPQSSYIWPPLSGKWKGKGKAADYTPMGGPRSKTPMDFASQEEHRMHYARVESCGFEDAPQQPSTRSTPYTPYRASFTTTNSVPVSDSEPQPKKPNKLQKPRPAPKTESSSNVPTVKMNDNGYPQADLREAEACYSATPQYQRRTVDGVEAKYQKETKYVSATAPPPQSKKEQKAEEKRAKKAEKERKKMEAKLDAARKDRQMEGRMRKLGFI